MISQKRLKEVLTYDKKTGVFRWKQRLAHCVKIGDHAGYVRSDGYRRIMIDGEKYLMHRLAWLYVYGGFPENEIDHINGDKDDNRMSNLRDVTSRTNCQNQTCHRNGKLVGGCYDKKRGNWQTWIRVGENRKFLGRYNTEQEAHEAYLKALESLSG